MKATVLIDNNAPEGLESEWGFSALIEGDVPEGGEGAANDACQGDGGCADGDVPAGDVTKVLLDAGSTGAFAVNAERLGIDLGDIDFAVLSHAHFDHSDGLDTFFDANSHAPLLLQDSCAENCYSDAKGDLDYIGVKHGMLDKHAGRLWRVSGVVEFAPGFWIVGHSADDAEKTAFDPHMFLEASSAGGTYADAGKDGPDDVPHNLTPDRFMHEQSLVVESPSGLVVFNSCSHSGVELIVDEVRRAFPDVPIYAIVGGLHLFTRTADEVREVARKLDKLGVQRIYTGHCTGDEALAILKQELGDKVSPFESGLVIEA